MRIENGKKTERAVPNKKSSHFYSLTVWMKEAVPDHLVDTYGCVWAMQLVGMSCSAAELGRRLNRTEGTIRRHIRELEELGFWSRQRRASRGITLSNRYLFRRLPEMPPAAAGEKHVAAERALPATGEGGKGGADALERMARTLGDKMICGEQAQHADKHDPSTLLSPELLAMLRTASPRHIDDCVRLLHQETQNMGADEARGLVVRALRAFVGRVGRGGVENPPGLLRVIVRTESSAGGGDAEAAELTRTVRGLDAELRAARSAFGIRRKARKRALFYRQLCELLGTAPLDVAAVPDFDGDRGALITEMVKKQLEAILAHARNDRQAATAAESSLNDLERVLERLIESEKGAAE